MLLVLFPLALVAGKANAQVNPRWDHYKAYIIDLFQPPPPGLPTVFLRDQFGTYNHTVNFLYQFMNPTTKEVGPPNPGVFPINDPDLHYSWWQISPQPFSGGVIVSNQFGDQPLNVFLDRVQLHIDAMNVAIADIPRDRVRLHVCWGNWNGPHQDDVDMKDLLPILYKAKVGALSIPMGNPRHEHETEVFRKLKLPKDMILIPGVIDVTTNYLEHPEVVANRICAVAGAVGDRERVIAGTDCGFGTFASYEFIAEDVVWAKLKALSDGAKIASRRLWSKGKAKAAGKPAKKAAKAKAGKKAKR